MEKQAPACTACNQGTLRETKIYRMSGPVVFIGYLVLVLSVLCVAAGFQLLISTETRTARVSEIKAGIREQLAEAEVPEAIIEKVLRREIIPQDLQAALTQEQRAALDKAVVTYRARMFGAGAGALLTARFSILLIVFSLGAGVLGWLLTMKKKVLHCTNCSAVSTGK